MIFARQILIPANTQLDDPLITTIPISLGTLRHVWVRWRWGSGNLCGCRILYASFQMWPLTMTDWFVSTPYPLDFEDDLPIDDVPTDLVVEAYNIDDTFEHRLWVAVSILRSPAALSLDAIASYISGEA